MSSQHSRTWDEDVHVKKGLALLTGTIHRPEIDVNDPPLGDALVALPMLALNSTHGVALTNSAIHAQPFSRDLAQGLLFVWKSLLFIPALIVMFLWARELYGRGAAWLVSALLCADPTFAAHIPIPALDVLGFEAIAFACWLCWRYARRPTERGAVGCVLAVAIALQIKHTAFPLPAIAFLIVLAWRLPGYLASDSRARRTERRRWMSKAARLGVVFVVASWALTGFDVSPPADWILRMEARQQAGQEAAGQPVTELAGANRARSLLLDRPWPAVSIWARSCSRRSTTSTDTSPTFLGRSGPAASGTTTWSSLSSRFLGRFLHCWLLERPHFWSLGRRETNGLP
jgi:hypothetical protein